MKLEALSKLKKFLKDQRIDFFLLPNSDEFFSEYLPENEKRIQYLTGFTGSNTTVIFGQEKSYFFTDGRYILQANQQLDLEEFEIFNIAEIPLFSWLEKQSSKEKRIAFDTKLSSVEFVKKLRSSLTSGWTGVVTPSTFSDFFREEMKVRTGLKTPSSVGSCIGVDVVSLPEKLTGLDSMSKRKQVLQGLEADAMMITRPENLCWLLNIRASDVEFTPLLLAYGILFKNGEVDLFIDEKRVKNLNLEKVNFVQPDCLDLRISILKKNLKKIQLDTNFTNYWLYELLEKNNFEIISKTDPCEILKAQKNAAEISGVIKAHEVDGLAVTKFLYWLENSVEIDEIKAAEKLLEFRKEDPNFLYPSFATIAGFASNGAVIHYHATQETNKKIQVRNNPPLEGGSENEAKHQLGLHDPGRGQVCARTRPLPESLRSSTLPQGEGEILLIDSGGQYCGEDFCGTTDVTRAIVVGNPTPEMIENFTRVLKGHIALARAKFPIGTTGAQLDALARNHLWQVGKDFDHGTGHGVGSFLSVHEGPQNISKRGHQPLLPGMILSNEPGFYKNGEYGIRIENLMLVEKFNEKFLQFKTLTLAPIDPKLIDFKMLTRPERKWLYEYHSKILEHYSKQEFKLWLQNILAIFLKNYEQK